jgi:hypothetical protein
VRREDRGRDQAWVADRLERDEPDAVGEPLRDVGSQLQRQPRLAGPARSGQRQEPGGPEQLARLGQLRLAADEARQLRRQVVRAAIQRADRRELGPLALDDELADPLRPEILEPVLAQSAQPDAGRELVSHEGRRGLGQEHLPTMTRRSNACRAVDVGPHVRTVAVEPSVARVDPHPDANGRIVRPALR